MSSFVPVAATVTSSPPSSPGVGGSPGGYRRRSGGSGGGSGRSRYQQQYHAPTPPSPEDLAYAAHLSLQAIDYIFSADSLAMDTYLRSLFDMEGWVPLLYIAQYPAVSSCGASWEGLKSQVRNNSVMLDYREENDCVRLKQNWQMWLPPGVNTKYALPSRTVAQVLPISGDAQQAGQEEPAPTALSNDQNSAPAET